MSRFAIVIDNSCAGFVLARRHQYEAFDSEQVSLGTFETEDGAVTTRRSRANFVRRLAVDRARIMSRVYQYPYPLPNTDEPKKEINDDRQISKRGNAPLGVRSAGIGRRSNGNRCAARPHQPQLRLSPRALVNDLRERGLLQEKAA
jgi:hypothetical protein